MWESPVNVIMGEMEMQVEKDIYKAVQNVGIDVNKEELIKAMQYDRNQYEKGYADAIAEYMNELCDKCLDMKNECYQLECPFCSDGCDIVNIAEQLKGGGNNG